MRVALIHNESAGDAAYKSEDLVGLLSAVGHQVRCRGDAKEDIRRAIRSEPDVIVVAGGDGTVARAATLVHKSRSQVPVYILPTGTANNIARSLGLGDDVPELIFALSNARKSRFDIGIVKNPWMKKQRFIEAAGFGFIGRMLELDGTAREKLGRAKRALRDIFRSNVTTEEKQIRGVVRLVRQQKPIACRLRAGGENLDGEYIGLEIMNIRRVGPSVILAPTAKAGDGYFDLLLLRPEDREPLIRYVESGGMAGLPGVRRRVRKLKMSWPQSAGHLDDEPWPRKKQNGSGNRVRIKAARPIELLLPKG